MSDSAPINRRMPVRNKAWSSTVRTRIGFCPVGTITPRSYETAAIPAGDAPLRKVSKKPLCAIHRERESHPLLKVTQYQELRRRRHHEIANGISRPFVHRFVLDLSRFRLISARSRKSVAPFHATRKATRQSDTVTEMNPRVALVTGASSGIGRACAAHLVARGVRVYGTSRTPSTGTMLQMDVTDDASIQRGIDSILQREGRLDIVVNNAGIAIAGPLELTSVEEAQRQLDVNLFGALRVCRAVLPIMRSQGSGYIVNVGSIGGLIAIPYQPLYSASKFALEGMTESLRMEVRQFGIRVVIVEPGDTKTEITQNRRMAAATVEQHVYRSLDAALKRTADDEQHGPGPEGVAQLLWRVVNTPNPRLRYTVGPPIQRAAVWMKRLLPYAVMEAGMRWYYGVG
jgi:NAD(P)-dependent dehydrogenase (short-subunit alcohol dehydrogenase family)